MDGPCGPGTMKSRWAVATTLPRPSHSTTPWCVCQGKLRALYTRAKGVVFPPQRKTPAPGALAAAEPSGAALWAASRRQRPPAGGARGKGRRGGSRPRGHRRGNGASQSTRAQGPPAWAGRACTLAPGATMPRRVGRGVCRRGRGHGAANRVGGRRPPQRRAAHTPHTNIGAADVQGRGHTIVMAPVAALRADSRSRDSRSRPRNVGGPDGPG